MELYIASFSNGVELIYHQTPRTEIENDDAAYRAIKSLLEERNTENSSPLSMTNWISVLDYTAQIKPDLLVLITDGWPNQLNKSKGHIGDILPILQSRSDQLKQEGTRIMLVSKNLASRNDKNRIVNMLMDGSSTIQIQASDYRDGLKFDHMTINTFEEIPESFINSLVSCKRNLEPSRKNSLQAYPNPSTNCVRFKSDLNLERGRLFIYNSIGKEVYSNAISGSLSQIDLDVSNYPAGEYTVVVQTAQEDCWSSKFIVFK
jgi:hypothetical protein